MDELVTIKNSAAFKNHEGFDRKKRGTSWFKFLFL